MNEHIHWKITLDSLWRIENSMEQRKHIGNFFLSQLSKSQFVLWVSILNKKKWYKFYINSSILKCIISSQHINCFCIMLLTMHNLIFFPFNSLRVFYTNPLTHIQLFLLVIRYKTSKNGFQGLKIEVKSGKADGSDKYILSTLIH